MCKVYKTASITGGSQRNWRMILLCCYFFAGCICDVTLCLWKKILRNRRWGEQAGTTEVQKSVQTGMVGWFCSWLERVWGRATKIGILFSLVYFFSSVFFFLLLLPNFSLLDEYC